MKKIKKTLVITISSLMALCVGGLAGCSSGGGQSSSSNTSSEEVIHVESVSLTGSKYVVANTTTNLECTVLPSNATNKNVTLESSNKAVAIVDAEGTVRGVKEGTATITVKSEDGEKTASLTIQVVAEGTVIANTPQALGDALAATPKQQNYATGQYGLDDPNTVGISATSEETELYPVMDDSEAYEVLEVDDLTVAQIRNYLSNDSAVKNDYYSIAAAIAKAKANGLNNKKSKIVFEDREYTIDAALGGSKYLFDINGLKNCDFEGNGATILEQVDGLTWKGYIKLTECEEVTINGFTFEQDVPAALTGEVTKYDVTNRKISLKVDSEFNELMKRLIAAGSSAVSPFCYTEYNKATKAPIANSNLVVSKEFEGAPVYGGDESSGYTVEFVVPEKTGIVNNGKGTLATLQYAQYERSMGNEQSANGFIVNDSTAVRFENVKLHHAAGMGLVGERDDGLYINRMFIEPKEGSNALTSCCADGLHFNECKNELKVTNSVIKYTNDDALNVKHGYWYRVSKLSEFANKQFKLSKITQAISMPQVGDKFAIYEDEDYTSRGEYTIASVSGSPSTELVITVNERVPASASTWKAARATFFSGACEFEFSNNLVGYKRNRGILVQVPNAVIENNVFTYVGQGSVSIHSALDVFNECTIPNGVQISNNKFINNNYMTNALYGDISVFTSGSGGAVGARNTITGIEIKNNFFTKNGNSAVTLNSVGDTYVENNFFYNVSQKATGGENLLTVFYSYNSIGMTLSENYNCCMFSDNQIGINIAGLTTKNSFTLQNNTNIDFAPEGEAGPEVEVKKNDSPITIDANLSDWDDAKAVDIAFDGVSLASGDRSSLAEVADRIVINDAKFTYDDYGLYFAFDVEDTQLDFSYPYQFWMGDCIEIIASGILDYPGQDVATYRDEGACLQMAFGFDTIAGSTAWADYGNITIQSARSNPSYIGKETECEVAYQKYSNNKGYVFEVFCPFDAFPEFGDIADANGTIDMAVVVADNDRSAGTTRLQISNVPHFVETYKVKTERMPQYILK